MASSQPPLPRVGRAQPAPRQPASQPKLVPQPPIQTPAGPSISDEDYRLVAGLVEANLGIKMPDTKKTMVATRLLRRLRDLNLSSYRAYCDLLRDPGQAHAELEQLSDLITTHKTEFFRERPHFDVLVGEVLPELERRGCASPAVWSAACSTGEEVYSIAMTLAERAEAAARPAGFTVHGSDVSPPCVEKATRGIYRQVDIVGIPEPLRRRFLRRSVDPKAALFRIVPDLRARTTFQCLNFMDRVWPVDRFDIVFCRNVLIYFSEELRLRILTRLCSHLRPHGYLFVGHSESVHGMKLPIRPFARATYQKV